MKHRIAFLTLSVVSFACVASLYEHEALAHSFAFTKATRPQQLNPPYLREMPSVDRVMNAMKVTDPRETALRQIGTFYQLIEIIKTLSGPREFRGFTPDENAIANAYVVAQYNVSQAAEKSFPGLTNQTPYRYGRWDRRFGVEGIQTFQTFFSAALKGEFDKIIQADNARSAARAQAYQNNAQPAKPTQPTQQQSGAATPGSSEELRRCIASGRSQRVCFTEVMTNGADQLTGASSFKTPPVPGLRMTGDYGAGGFRLIFRPDNVTMVCKGVPSQRAYSVDATGAQALVKISDGAKPIVFSLMQNGNLSGAGPIRVTGQVAAGTRTEQTMGTTTQRTTRERQLSPGEERNYQNAQRNGQVFTVKEDASELVYGPTGTTTVIDYVTKTADCTLGVLSPIGATPLPPDPENPMAIITTLFSGLNVLMNGGSTADATKEMLSPDDTPAPGLRMIGRYAGDTGFSVIFHPETATIACYDSERAYPYSMQKTDNQILLRIQNNANPLTLQLRPDGSIIGQGELQVDGRTIVGVNEDPKNRYAFAPKVGRCSMGTLTAGGTLAAGKPSSNASSAAQPPPSSTPSAAAASTPATQPNGGNATPGAPAALTIASGFPGQPGAANPLAGKTFLVLKSSFEDILSKTGWFQPGQFKPLTVWARACEAQGPLCQQGIEAARPYFVSSAKLDANGGFKFDNARAGTYYIFGQIPYNGRHLVWNLRIDLTPGANSVTLSESNTTPIDR